MARKNRKIAAKSDAPKSPSKAEVTQKEDSLNLTKINTSELEEENSSAKKLEFKIDDIVWLE